jgi:hypothetical protein
VISHVCERAIDSAFESGNALLKFLSANDAGITGTHQEGFYLPIGAWEMYTPHAPEKGVNAEEEVEILWHDGTITTSRIKWYGKGKEPNPRHEYRLTRFGKDFPFHNADVVGDLWILVPKDYWHFEAFLLDRDEDIEILLAALGVQPFGTGAHNKKRSWGVFQQGAAKVETESDCLERNFQEFVSPLSAFPTGEVFSQAARAFVDECVKLAKGHIVDTAFIRWMEVEYQLFQRAERQICQTQIARTFKDVDDFLKTARSIGNRRMSRGGRSLENHVHHVLSLAGIPHDMRPALPGKPDVVIPSADAYRDNDYPLEKLCVIGIKMTCKDRWRQVLNEAKRVDKKHLLTMQQAISPNQLTEMQDAGLTLIVPKKLQKGYPEHPIKILTIDEFIGGIRTLFS